MCKRHVQTLFICWMIHTRCVCAVHGVAWDYALLIFCVPFFYIKYLVSVLFFHCCLPMLQPYANTLVALGETTCLVKTDLFHETVMNATKLFPPRKLFATIEQRKLPVLRSLCHPNSLSHILCVLLQVCLCVILHFRNHIRSFSPLNLRFGLFVLFKRQFFSTFYVLLTLSIQLHGQKQPHFKCSQTKIFA